MCTLQGDKTSSVFLNILKMFYNVLSVRCFERAEMFSFKTSCRHGGHLNNGNMFQHSFFFLDPNRYLKKRKLCQSRTPIRLMYLRVYDSRDRLVSLHLPRPYATRSHMHTGPLVIGTRTPSFWMNPPRD